MLKATKTIKKTASNNRASASKQIKSRSKTKTTAKKSSKASIVDESLKKKVNIRGAKQHVLSDGTICYTKPIRYPEYMLQGLRDIWYDKKLKNMSEAIFYCIEYHERENFINADRYVINKTDKKSLTIRFREHHYDYILRVCEMKSLNKFTDGVIYVLDEYFKSQREV